MFEKTNMQLDLPESLNTQMIRDLILTHKQILSRYETLSSYYNGNFDINLNTTAGKPDTKIKADFGGYIVDTLRGYFIGKPISYASTEEDYLKIILEINNDNDEHYHNTNIATEVGVLGEAYELVYLDEEKNIQFTRLPASETLVVYNTNLKPKMELAMRYYTIKNITNNSEIVKVELYWPDKIQYFTGTENTYYLEKEEPHIFGEVPVVHFMNNDFKHADFEKVITEINAYSKIQSMEINEIEAFRNAYLTLYGVNVSSEEAEKFEETGIIPMCEGGRAEFLTKDVNDTMYEHQLTRLDSNIHRLSKVPNMSDENFFGNASGIAMKYKMYATEEIACTKQAKFTEAIKKRIRLITKILNIKKGTNFDWKKINLVFSRNIPEDESVELEIAIKQKQLGIISDETILAKLSCVDNVADELSKIKKQNTNQPEENL